MTFEWWIIVAIGAIGVVASLLYSAFDYDEHKHINADVIRRTESALGRLQG